MKEVHLMAPRPSSGGAGGSRRSSKAAHMVPAIIACAASVTILLWASTMRGAAVHCPGTLSPTPQVLELQQYSQCPSKVTPFPRSFWYVKTHKTGSSTLSGVFRSVCAHYGITAVRRDLLYDAQPKSLFQPGTMDTANMSKVLSAVDQAYNASEVSAVGIVNHLKYSPARAAFLKAPFFRFSSVRHPVARIYSQFVDDNCWGSLKGRKKSLCFSFNATSVFGQSVLSQDTLQNRWKYVRRYPHNHCFNYMRGAAATPKEVLDQYDFVFVAERMDESLVAFMMLYGLSHEDIAYLRSKDKTGLYKSAKEMPEDLNSYIETHNPKDIELWNLANARLNDTIQQLQPECFQQQLRTFAAIQAAVKRECADFRQWYADHGLSNTTYSYVSDNGWGFRCVTHVAREFLKRRTYSPTRVATWH